MIINKIEELIGNTPVIKLNNLVSEDSADVYVKLENLNLTANVKIRPAYQMIIDAIASGILTKDKTIVEPTSGNTGIGLAYIANLLGYKIEIVMPETMSLERRQMIEAYNAKLILTPGEQGMKGAIAKANELVETGNYVLLQQFENEANVKAHYLTTAQELLNDFKAIDAFVAGIGTGGTITGVGKRLKENLKDVKIIGLEPSESAILTNNSPGPHKIQGIGAGFIPSILDRSLIDDVLTIKQDDALNFVKEVYLKEGLFLGISSAANILGALEVAKKLGKGKTVITIAPDGGEKYLTNNVFNYD